MNTLKAEAGRSSLVLEENNPAPAYAILAFYGIHTFNFIDRANETTDRPVTNLSKVRAEAALQFEVKVQ